MCLISIKKATLRFHSGQACPDERKNGFLNRAPGGGLEPPTSSLTARRSTAELPGNVALQIPSSIFYYLF